jgi:hypothetical protein
MAGTANNTAKDTKERRFIKRVSRGHNLSIGEVFAGIA